MRTKIALLTSLAALGVLVPAAAFAQDAAAPAPAPAPAAAPAAPAAPAPEAPPAAAPAAEAAPAAAAVAADVAPAGPKPAPGWMRLDSDFFGLQAWAGGTLPLTDTIGLAMDIYLNAFVPASGATFPNHNPAPPSVSAYGEYDIGPAITAGPVVLTPMIGFQFDWTRRHAQALVPQFYITGGPSPIYAEMWLQWYNNKIFNKTIEPNATTGDPGVVFHNQVNFRLFADYKVSDYFAVGPEFDMNYDSGGYPNHKGDSKKVYAMPVGPNFMFSNLGANSTLFAFVGYDLADGSANDNHVAGRLSYVHNF